MLINTALKLRVFEKINYNCSRLPSRIQSRASRKGWMTSELFYEWILSLNKIWSDRRETFFSF